VSRRRDDDRPTSSTDKERLIAALNRMSTVERAIFFARHVDGLRHDVIARRLGISRRKLRRLHINVLRAIACAFRDPSPRPARCSRWWRWRR
jgi:DNA-directed RNA polymerase specialized sigma24 family protein